MIFMVRVRTPVHARFNRVQKMTKNRLLRVRFTALTCAPPGHQGIQVWHLRTQTREFLCRQAPRSRGVVPETVGVAPVVVVTAGEDFPGQRRSSRSLPSPDLSLSQQVWSHATKVAALHDGPGSCTAGLCSPVITGCPES